VLFALNLFAYLQVNNLNVNVMKRFFSYFVAIAVLHAMSFSNSVAQVAFSFTAGNLTYSENFDGMEATGTNKPTGWVSIPDTLRITHGTATTGSMYNVGASGSDERALGTLASGGAQPVFGASFTNNTGDDITKISLQGFCEQWRTGSSAAVNEIVAFAYSFDATSLTTGTWTALPVMDLFEILTTTTSSVAVDGNHADNRAAISGTINGITWTTGQTLWIRWTDIDNTGSDGLYAIDDLEITVSSLNTDFTSSVYAPTSQIIGGTISSLATTISDAVTVFNFMVKDFASGDNLPTGIKKMRFKPHTTNTVNWENHIAGIKLEHGDLISSVVPIATTTINNDYIELIINAGDFEIADGEEDTVFVSIYLKGSNLTDGGIISMYIDANSHGFFADTDGSGFVNDFTADVISSDFEITVIATGLKFTQQPSNVVKNEVITPAISVAFVDANNNIDIDITDEISITATGATLIDSPVEVAAVAGVATFSAIKFSDSGNGVTLTAEDKNDVIGTTQSITSTTFDVWDELLLPKVIISQVYEGTSFNKWVEITNVGDIDANLADLNYYLAIWAITGDDGNANMQGTISARAALSGTLQPNASILFKNTSAVIPGYATGTTLATVSFNGNDAIAIVDADTNIIDGFGHGINNKDVSHYRNANISEANPVFDITEWTEVTLADVDNALAETTQRLGYHYFGPDTTAPVFVNSTPEIINIASTEFTLSVSMDEPGTVYYVVLDGSSASPSITQVMAGKDAAGDAVSLSGTIGITTANDLFSTVVSSLTADTDYDVHIVAKDNADPANIQNSTIILSTKTLETPAVTDSTSAAYAPSTQVPAGTIASTFTSIDDAVKVLSFIVKDSASGDNLPTQITKLRFLPHTTNTANWEQTIAGLLLERGDAVPDTLTLQTTTITNAYIELQIASDGFVIADGEADTVFVSIFLHESGIVDGDTISLFIDADNHGFMTDASGSCFANTFNTDIISNDFKVQVTATTLQFVQQPTDVFMNETISPSVSIAFTDIHGNIDTDINDTISVTATGATLVNAPVEAAAVAGIALFPTLSFSDYGDEVVLIATDRDNIMGTDVVVASDTFEVWNEPVQPKVIISQVYEGISNNKWVEITNMGNEDVDLGQLRYRLAIWTVGGSIGNGEISGPPSQTSAISGIVQPGKSVLFKHTSAVLPAYASGTANAAINFNGNDAIALVDSTINIIDAFGHGINNVDVSYYRKAYVSEPNAAFNLGEWTLVSLGIVEDALPETTERLGYHYFGPDTTAPVFVNSTPEIYGIHSTGFTVSVSINEKGTVYYVVLDSGSVQPSITQIIAGQDADGNTLTPNRTGAIGVGIAYDAFSAGVFNLEIASPYEVYFVAADSAATPNIQDSAIVLHVTTLFVDVEPPVFEPNYPAVSNITTNSFVLEVSLDEAGKVYFVVLPDGDTAPSVAQIKARTDALGNPVAAPLSGVINVNLATTVYTASVTTLNADTEYDVYLVAEDLESPANIQNTSVKVDVRTEAEPTASNLLFISEVIDPLDVANAKFVELYNADTVAIDFDVVTYFISRQANGTTWGNVKLTGIILPGSAFVIANNQTSFNNCFGFDADQYSGIITGNGNDGYFLYYGGNNTTGVLVDAFGEKDVDGTGTPWEYTDSRAVRNPGIYNPNPVWTAAEWTIIPASNCGDASPGEHILVGINTNVNLDVEFVVYPNPTKGSFNIVCPEGNWDFVLNNISNQQIISSRISGNTNFTLSLESGIYVAILKNETRIFYQKIIVQ